MFSVRICTAALCLATALGYGLRGARNLKSRVELQLTDANGKQKMITDLDEINRVLARSGAGVFPRPYHNEPAPIQALLAKDAALSKDEQKAVYDHFVLNRKQIEDTVAAVPGRKPLNAYSDIKGSLSSTDYKQNGLVEGHYPVFFHMFNKTDLKLPCKNCTTSIYSSFHTQSPREGSVGKGEDEVMQILRGDTVWVWATVDGSNALPVRLSVRASKEQGWIVTYPGSTPHVGIVGGSKKNLPYWGVAQIVGGSSFTQQELPSMKDPWANVPLPF